MIQLVKNHKERNLENVTNQISNHQIISVARNTRKLDKQEESHKTLGNKDKRWGFKINLERISGS